MRGVGVIIAVVLVVAVLVIAGTLFVFSSGTAKKAGFDSADLKVPTYVIGQYSNGSVPSSLSPTTPSYDLTMSWEITADIYAGYGGALSLSVRNTNPTGKLLVYSLGIQWYNGATYERNCNVTISHGTEANLGLLAFGAPAIGNAEYQVFVRIAASNTAGTMWKDIGKLDGNDWNSVTIQSLASDADPVVSQNIAPYYNMVNERIDYSAVQSVVSLIKAKYPGNYSMLQIAAAYEWAAENVVYQSEPAGQDYWQSTAETMTMRTGDCEDFAILMSSIIGALGGNARVNVIEEHAFPTVYIADDAADLAAVKASLASFYGMDTSSYKLSYLHDEYGYWLVVDPTGFPYAGGIPAKSAPTSSGDNWTVLSSFIYTIDATGTPVENSFLGIF